MVSKVNLAILAVWTFSNQAEVAGIWSKIESGKVDLVLEDVSLPDVVDNIVSICRPMMVEKQQEFKVNIFNVRNEHVITDGDRLQQVFL